MLRVWCVRNISHILNCYLCYSNELRQLVIVAPSYHFFFFFFFFQICFITFMVWTDKYFAFVEMFFNIGESVIASQRTFWAHFMLCQNDAVLE